MRVLHIASSLDPRSGGPTRSIKGLCRGLAQNGVPVTLFVHQALHDSEDIAGLNLRKGSGLGWSEARRATERVLDEVKPGIVHLHGLWMGINHLAVGAAKRRDIPVMFSVRGMLDPWALRQKRLKKKIAWRLYQQRDLRYAAALHATAAQEAENIRVQGLLQPIAVIPNGVDIPKSLPERQSRSDGKKMALFLSRLHPGKGLLDLVAAWAMVRPQGWLIRVVGPDVCGHKAEVEAAIARVGLSGEFEFGGEKSDQDKWQEYANADLFVHPSHSENFGISIAEALAAGVPVVTTKGTPWRELEGETPDYYAQGTGHNGRVKGGNSHEESCGRSGWWVEVGVAPLAEALKEAMGLSDEKRRILGENGQRLVAQKYRWQAVAEEMMKAYNSVWRLHTANELENGA